MDKYSYWTRRYADLASTGKDRAGYEYTPEALGIFPRYHVLNAVLVEIERHRANEFASLDEAKRAFRAMAADAQNIFTQPPNGPIEQRAMSEEREALDRFIANLTDTDLAVVEPLFYRRVLNAEESSDINDKLRQVWSVTEAYWYPLADRKREDIEAFQDSYFEKEVGAEKLRTIFRSHGIERIWEIREDGINYEEELSVLEPFYNGNECYWCDATFDWIIYASHESSISVGGWLLAEVKSVWPNWERRVWTTPFFDRNDA